MKKIDVSIVKLGTCFSQPLFFEDGQNMFLADNKRATRYHLDVLRDWKVPFLLTDGEEIPEPVEHTLDLSQGVAELEEL